MRVPLRHLPNVISACRILLVVPIVLALSSRDFVTTLWLFGVAAVSDAVDGWLARRFGWESHLGAVLDPIADKLMLASVFVTLAWLQLVPWWLTATALVRDVIIVLGAAAYRVSFGTLDMQPTLISKLNTLCQIAFVLAVIGHSQTGQPVAWLILALGALTFVTLAVSGIDYVLVWGRLAVERTGGRAFRRAENGADVSPSP